MKLIDIVSEEIANIRTDISKNILSNDSINKVDSININTLYTSIDNKLKMLISINTYEKWIEFVTDLFDLLTLKDTIMSSVGNEDIETEMAVGTVANTYKSIMRKMNVNFNTNYTYIYILLILLYIKSENSPDFLEMDLVGDIDKILIQIANKFANVKNTYLKLYTLTAIYMLIKNIDQIKIKIADMQEIQVLVAELVKAQEDNSSTSAKVKQRMKTN